MTVAAPERDQDVRVARLAELVAEEMAGAGAGHCARVNFLDRGEADAICRHLRDRGSMPSFPFQTYVLAASGADDPLTVTTDRAIELRNRKREPLCLFVPADLVDATISSLGNSFADIDGRELHRTARERVMADLAPATRELVREVLGTLRYALRASEDAQLDFVLAAAGREQRGEIDDLGFDLWRVGLIADARPDFERHLGANRRAVRLLARPPKIDAPFRARIASLSVADDTARRLEQFFARRPMHDVPAWSRDLADGQGPTLDAWVFPEAVRSNLESVRVRPLTDANGTVTKQSKLEQPDGPGGTLLAPCGEKCAIAVHWETEPRNPVNVHAWQVSLVPAGEDTEADDIEVGFDLPARDVKGSSRTARIKLDLEFSEPPETPFSVRVVAIDEAGNEVLNEGDERPIAAVSDPFYLIPKGTGPGPVVGSGQRRRTVSTLAEGRLRAAVEGKDAEIVLTQPAWTKGHGVEYFTARANERTLLNVAVSPFLLDLERRTLASPRGWGRWRLDLDEAQPASPEAVVADPPATPAEDAAWTDLLRARTSFFERLCGSPPRDAIEAAEWTPEVTNAALRYAQAYGSVLDGTPADALRDALSIDTLFVRLRRGEAVEDAVVVLPTHPLRAAWFASHAALLRKWEEQVLQHDGSSRRGLVDLNLVRDLRPSNIPAFALGRGFDDRFVFFQNLAFFHGVALPADAADPLRRFRDLAVILGFGSEPIEADDRRPERFAHHLRDFMSIHPYVDPFQITLVNPDQGEFLADSLDRLRQPGIGDAHEDEELPTSPAIDVTAYVLDDRQSGLRALDRLRTRQLEQRTRHGVDHLQPALAATVLPLERADASGFRAGHVAAVSDLSRPRVRALPDASPEHHAGNLSLYGLIARFIGDLEIDADATRWRYGVASPAKSEPHPAGPRFGDTLAEVQAAYLHALGRVLEPTAAEQRSPILEVELDRQHARRVEQLHAEIDWVVTLDRFFGVDYYDSPSDGVLGAVARKYLIDYAPEFTDGLGHRMIVTTAWREEVTAVLRRAMDELGFATIDSSVGKLLHYLNTVSGRIALRTLRPGTSGAEAVSLGAVTAWLQAKRRLDHAVLVPIDAHLGLFGATSGGVIEPGERRCDLALFGLRRGIVDVSFIEVKGRCGPLGAIDDLVEDMASQMRTTAQAVGDRFFNPERVDGPLQRAYLANVLRFYCARAQRYGLLQPSAANAFLTQLSQLEKPGLDFRPSFEGYIVSLEDSGRRPFVQDNLTSTVLTAHDFEHAVGDILPAQASASAADATEAEAIDVATQPGSTREDSSAADHRPDQSPASAETPAIPDSTGGSIEEAAAAAREVWPAGTSSDEPIVTLGDGLGGPVTWKPSVKGSPHLFITGIPGQGKSWTVLRLLTELHRHGVPSLVFDFHGQLGDPSGPYAQTAHPIVIDAADGLPFSPFECTIDSSASGWKASALAVAEIFGYVCGLGDIQQDTLYTCIRDAYRAYGFGADGVGADEPTEFPSLDDVLHRIEQAETQRRSQNLIARCRPLLELDIFRPPAGGRNALIDAVRHGLVVDLHRLASETLQTATGAFVLRKMYRDMFRWGEANRLRLAIVLDEAHRLAHDVTLPKIMKEGRKYGVTVVVASQGLADFHPDVLGNAGSKIAFRANHPDSRKIAGYFRARGNQDLVAVLEQLSVGSAVVQTPDMPVAATTQMLPPDRL